MADLTVYVPDHVADRARELELPLSRSTREILLSLIRAFDGGDPGDPVALILTLMGRRDLIVDEGDRPGDDQGRNGRADDHG